VPRRYGPGRDLLARRAAGQLSGGGTLDQRGGLPGAAIRVPG